MIIYLAATAPGKRDKPLIIKKRLLSFHHINCSILEADVVFKKIRSKK